MFKIDYDKDNDSDNLVNSQTSYNKNAFIKAIPILTCHNVGLDNNMPYSTDVILFEQDMKYLHDNGFRVLTMNQLDITHQIILFT